jgi:hypothetical protein
LKSISTDQGAANLACDADERNRIHFRVRNARDEIRRAGTACGESNTHFSGGTRISFSGEDGSLLVSRENVTHTAAIERIVKWHDRAAGVTEDEVNAFRSQTA